MHNIGKPVDDVTPRGPNRRLRKNNQDNIKNRERVKEGREEDIDQVDIEKERLENLDHRLADSSGTVQASNSKFTWVEMMSGTIAETGLLE